MRLARFVIGIGASCAVACGGSSLSSSAARIREGDETTLADCSFLQKVEGRSSKSENDAAQRDAKNAALEAAAKLGATHVRWIVPCCTTVEAEAYHCDVPE